jgi:hypothetical protein
MGPDHERELAGDRRVKYEFKAARPGGASQWAGFDVGDLEVVGERGTYTNPHIE